MMEHDLSTLAAFLAVADERSFTRAARTLGVSQSALSHAIRRLEQEIGVRLLARTTRSVAPTEAGEELLAELRPALDGIRKAIGRVSDLRDTPRGRVRLVSAPLAVMNVLGPAMKRFTRDYPDVILDVHTDEAWSVDLVARGFDAGIQYGEFIQKDMIAVRVSPDYRAAIVASPDYFEHHPKPTSPRDLLHHRCLNYRHGSGDIYRWEFDNGDESLVVAVNGPVITDDIDLLVRAALDGVGITFLAEEHAKPFLERRELVRVLADWCQPFPGFFLYYPSRQQQPAALTAVIETLRVVP